MRCFGISKPLFGQPTVSGLSHPAVQFGHLFFQTNRIALSPAYQNRLLSHGKQPSLSNPLPQNNSPNPAFGITNFYITLIDILTHRLNFSSKCPVSKIIYINFRKK